MKILNSFKILLFVCAAFAVFYAFAALFSFEYAALKTALAFYDAKDACSGAAYSAKFLIVPLLSGTALFLADMYCSGLKTARSGSARKCFLCEFAAFSGIIAVCYILFGCALAFAVSFGMGSVSFFLILIMGIFTAGIFVIDIGQLCGKRKKPRKISKRSIARGYR